ncbi:MAG: helix-turn-helix domain-containing protein [Thermomicrobiales bacterium]|nr:helix-turn-helix domain-containing protein [Thermomicrobiales bacterium]
MTATDPRQYMSVKEACEFLGATDTAVKEAIRTGKLKAIVLGETLATARIHISSLLPPDVSASDLHNRRLKTLTLAAMDRLDALDRKIAEVIEAKREADTAIREIHHALHLDEMDTRGHVPQNPFLTTSRSLASGQ